jgi:hypothetical protein
MLGRSPSGALRGDATLLWLLFSGPYSVLDRDANHGSDPMQSADIPKARVRLWFVLGGLAAFGVVAIAGSHWVPWKWLEGVVKEIGVASLVAAILGLTVDQALKVELVRDVFYAAFRYLLPSELKDEVARVIGYRFLCTDHRTLVEIVPIVDTDLVRVHMKTERLLKNVSYQAEPIRNHFALDEWGYPGHQSTVERCSMEFGGEVVEGEDNPEYKGKLDARGKITAERTIKRGETVKFVTIGSEVCRNNGQLFMAWRAPTVNPVVDVSIPDGFGHECNFGVPYAKAVTSSISKQYRLDGTQFPGQHVRVRWWKIESSTALAAPLS